MTIPSPAVGAAAPVEQPPRPEDRFVAYIRRVCEDNGARAALRRAIRRTPAQAYTAHRFLASWTEGAHPYREAVFYQSAAWIAQYDRKATGTPLSPGRALAASTRRSGHGGISANTTESRLTAISRSSGDALLYVQVPQMLNQIASTGQALAWGELIRDLLRWPFAEGDVAKRWMTDYYRALAPSPSGAAPAATSLGSAPDTTPATA